MILLLMSLALAVLATFMTAGVVVNEPVDAAYITLILCLSVVFLIISEIVT